MSEAFPKPSPPKSQTRPSSGSGADSDVMQLWLQYKNQPNNPQIREKLILKYLHLVRYVVSRLPISLPVSIAQEDLISYGTMGLMEAVERYDVTRGLKFENVCSDAYPGVYY